MKKIISALLAAAMACTLFAGCQSEVVPSSSATGSTGGTSTASAASNTSTAASNLSGKLTLNGSTSMTSVCDALGEAFMKKYPNVTYEKANTGSGSAVTAVNDGNAMIGDLSRDLKEEEKPDDFDIYVIALDGIAVAVNNENPVSDLTQEQIAKIFTGEITNWSEVGGDNAAITVIGRESSSGTRDGFESIFGIADKCKYATELGETGQVVQRVSSDKNAIGYVSLASAEGVKALKVDGVEATEENVANGNYKVQRNFTEITKKGSTDPIIKAWFDFLRSDEGQQIIKDQKLVTVKIAK